MPYWNGDKKGEGFEFHVLAAAMAISLVVMGSGDWSIDAWIAESLTASP